jgi:hypothetical protein
MVAVKMAASASECCFARYAPSKTLMQTIKHLELNSRTSFNAFRVKGCAADPCCTAAEQLHLMHENALVI